MCHTCQQASMAAHARRRCAPSDGKLGCGGARVIMDAHVLAVTVRSVHDLEPAPCSLVSGLFFEVQCGDSVSRTEAAEHDE